ncbi:MAG: hypothetical protein K1060chlam1_00529 [Candidatus Anoxychlamydiales bacterium]|nr:hypothetical protein [Candidatus Anoxychlamydiales bacterium]
MKKKYSLIIFLFLALSSFSITGGFSKKTFVYKTLTGKKETTTTYLIKKRKDDLLVTKTNEIEIANIIYSLKFALKEMHVKSAKEDTDYKFTIDNRKLTLIGKARGRRIKRQYTLPDRWIQDFTFGLRPFLNSKRQRYSFVILNPNDFTTNELIASKEGIEKIKINNSTYKAQRVNVTLSGFKSMFWKADVWYDLHTFDLLKYKANEGPGTPMSTMFLDSKN